MYRYAPRHDALASFRDDVPTTELGLSPDGVLLVRCEPVPGARVLVHTRCRWRGFADLHFSHGVGRGLAVIVAASMVTAVAGTMLVVMQPYAPAMQGVWVMTMSGLAAASALSLGMLALSSVVRWLARILLELHVEQPWAESVLSRVADTTAWLVVDADGRRVARWRLHRRADTRAIAALRSVSCPRRDELLEPMVAAPQSSVATS